MVGEEAIRQPFTQLRETVPAVVRAKIPYNIYFNLFLAVPRVAGGGIL